VTSTGAIEAGAVYPSRVAYSGWLFLAAMIGVYGVANLLQSYAAARTPPQHRLTPGLLLRLASHRTYLAGVVCQFLGFLLAFFARRDLPLFLVQSAAAAGLGVTTILGVMILKWRLPLVEVVLLIGLGAGVAALVISAEPAPSQKLGITGEIALTVTFAVIAVLGLAAVRLRGALGSVVLGLLAGLAFGAAAVTSRPLAGDHGLREFTTDPLLYLLIAYAILGQLLLGLAMQRGSTTAAVAAMDAASAVPAAIIGLLFLGDKIEPGKEWLAGVGFALTLGAVLGLTRYAEPQHHHAQREEPPDPIGGPLPLPHPAGPVLAAPGLAAPGLAAPVLAAGHPGAGPLGPGHPVPGHPVPGHPVPGHPGPGHPGSAYPGTGHPGTGHPGTGHPGSGHANGHGAGHMDEVGGTVVPVHSLPVGGGMPLPSKIGTRRAPEAG